MTRHLRTSAYGTTPAPSLGRPCPGGNPDHVILDLPEDDARQAGLPVGCPVHVDRSRHPSTGDLVWVELVRHGNTQRLVRLFARDHGWVTLSTTGGSTAAIMRRTSELLVLGVVDLMAACAAPAAQTGPNELTA